VNRHRSPIILISILAIGLLSLACGCTPEPPKHARALAAPPRESPVCNLPATLHQRNELGPLGQGSCVHASLVNHLRWLNQFTLADRWWKTYHDGEYASRLMQRLDAANVDYVFTEKADPRFLDWCTETKRGAILWWKPSHCCTFAGWTVQQGKTYAVILDNNRPGNWELTEREQFVRLWAGYGGFALAVLQPPASAITWQSYEVVQ
jgi:hypothetical protein